MSSPKVSTGACAGWLMSTAIAAEEQRREQQPPERDDPRRIELKPSPHGVG